ncbi:MAG: TetR/AcrR family transcriptional regulator [Asticcacaulis sp.]
METQTACAAPNLKREEILDRALQLFYDGGFHATGVDAVMDGTGISKRTLYKYFPSKEHLIEAVLQRYAGAVDGALFEPALARTADPRGQIRAIFDVRREAMEASRCQGCLAMKAAGEYAGKHAGIEAAGRESSVYVETRFAELCAKAGLDDAVERGRQINLLFQGAVQTSQMRGDTETFAAAMRALDRLL